MKMRNAALPDDALDGVAGGFKELGDLPSKNATIACPYCHADGVNDIGMEVDVWDGIEGGAVKYTCFSCYKNFIVHMGKCHKLEDFKSKMQGLKKTVPSAW